MRSVYGYRSSIPCGNGQPSYFVSVKPEILTKLGFQSSFLAAMAPWGSQASSSAVKIVKNIDNNKILFIPDCNLGAWVEEQVPEKTFKFVHGGCPTHLRMSIADVEKAKAAHPAAKLLVHPECLAEVSKAADYIGSTTGIIDYAKNSTDREFIIGTENSILQHLQYECPEKSFYPLSKDCVCHNMKLTTLMDVYNCVCGQGGEEIILPDDIRTKAKACIDTMLTLGE